MIGESQRLNQRYSEVKFRIFLQQPYMPFYKIYKLNIMITNFYCVNSYLFIKFIGAALVNKILWI